MQGLTDNQIARQDYVDNTIFELIQILNPTSKEVDWDIELIAKVRDTVEHYFVEQLEICDKYTFYPYIDK